MYKEPALRWSMNAQAKKKNPPTKSERWMEARGMEA